MSSRNVVDLRKRKPGGFIPDQAPLPLRPRKRISPVRLRRRRTRLAATSIIFALAVAGILVASYVSYLPRFSIEVISVQGAQAVSSAAVTDYAESIIYDGSHHFFSRANVLLYPKALIEKDLPLEFPRIASATISQASPLSNSITISVAERQPFALWCADASGSHCYMMDADGFIFASAPSGASVPSGYIFTGGIAASTLGQAAFNPIGQTFAPAHVEGLAAFLQLLGGAGVTPLGADVQNDQDFSVPLAQGFSVYASFGEDPGALASNLQLVLSSSALSGQQKNLEYVDLRFGNKVYYKLKGQDQAESSSSPQ